MKNPLVSVIITSYNQREYIGLAIGSVLNQTYPNIEIIVIDDASTDGTQEIIKEISSEFEDERVRFIPKQQNEGVTYCRNIGLAEFSGEYICFLDGDDMYLPGKIGTQVDHMESNEDWMISYHDADTFDSASGETIFFYSDRFGVGNGTVYDLISKGMYIHFGSLMYRRKSIAFHTFNTQVRIVDDWLFTIEVLLNGNQDFFYIDKVLSKYRRHSTNITLDWDEKIRQNFDALDIVGNKYKSAKFHIRSRQAELYFIFTVFSFMKRNFFDVFKGLLNYFIYSFPNPLRFTRILVREIKFLSTHEFQFDSVIKSLWLS
ncbi:MAG: glycosyltransferase [Anaerolineae bacterium]|nr:glycosyltransferase [Anaerolineae bacterium]